MNRTTKPDTGSKCVPPGTAGRESVVLNWLRERIPTAERGTVAALMPFFGAWQMTTDERERIERLIHDERSVRTGCR